MSGDDYWHGHLRRVKGLATQHNCVDCGKPAREWSQIDGTKGTDIHNDYEPRCRPCHLKYDKHLLGSRNHQAKLHESDIVELRELHATGDWTHLELADLFGISKSHVTNIIHRRKWGHI